MEEYKHIDYFFKDKTNFIIKLQNVCIYRYVCCEMNSFFQHFHKYFPRIHRSVTYKITIDVSYFWDFSDVNLWEKLAITIKLRYIETRLKQGYDLRGYFEKSNRNDKCFNNHSYSLFFFMNVFFRSSRSDTAMWRCSPKKVFVQFHKILQQKNLCLWPATLFKKRVCYRCLSVIKLLRSPFLIGHLWWVLLFILY